MIKEIKSFLNLPHENASLRQALSKAVGGVMLTDLKNKITFVNKEWASMHGYTETQLDGKPIDVLPSISSGEDSDEAPEDQTPETRQRQQPVSKNRAKKKKKK